MTLADLLKNWSTADLREKLDRLDELPTPLSPELEAQRMAVQAEWDRRPAQERQLARADAVSEPATAGR